MSTSSDTGIPCCCAERGGMCGSLRIISVDMQQFRAGYVFGANFRGREAQAIRAMPEDGALAGALVDQNVGCLIGTLVAQNQAGDVYARFLQALALNFPRKSSPIVPMYLARSPSFAHATTAVATCPPGLNSS